MTPRAPDRPIVEPEPPTGQLALPAPPRLERSEGVAGVLAGAVPMLGSLGSILIVATLAGGGSGSTMRVRSLLAGGVFLMATLAYVLVQVDRQRRQHARQVSGARADHLHQVAQARARIRESAAQQRAALTWHHPDPRDLPLVAMQRHRRWRSGPEDPRFLQVRYGLSTQPLSIELITPAEATSSRVDPAASAALHRLKAVHTQQPELPDLLDLRGGRIELEGPDDRVRALARAVMCQAAARHSPEQLAVAVMCSEDALAHWDWVKWLPHAASPQRSDALGSPRMVSTEPSVLEPLLPRDGHLLLVIDDRHHRSPPEVPDPTAVLDLGRSSRSDSARRIVVSLQPGDARTTMTSTVGETARESTQAYADQLDLASAEAFARRLAPLRLAALPSATGAPTSSGAPSLTGLLGLPPAKQWGPASGWGRRNGRDLLRVPVGTDSEGRAVHLDLKESAQHGMGPHGLVVGATGSGKSELLRSVVLGLAMTHSPEQLNLVLVDFKGGATFAGMASMPHTAAVITNLDRELTLVDRMHDALAGEMVRRQELLRASGNCASLGDYEQARLTGEPLEPLSSLFIVVDEFSELLSAKPELIELFVAIGRLGRSLGLHLLLASQRLEEGRLRGLESHLSYRIGLRTFSASESRAVLGTAAAHELPAVPGLGYLRSDPTTLRQFRAAYVSGPVDDAAPTSRTGHPRPTIQPFTVLPVEPAATGAADFGSSPASGRESTGPIVDQTSQLDLVVARMSGQGPAAHQVWLPPLAEPDTLDALMPDLATDPDLGLVSPHWREQPGLAIPVGTVDRPREQRREPLIVDLAGATGHVAVIGGPRSGRSTLLRTLVAGLALTRTPEEVQFFVLDFGGGAFGPLAGLPHLSGSASRPEPDVVRRIVAEVTGILDRREQHFAERAIDSIEAYRSARLRGCTGDGYGDVVLMVDGWSTVRADFEELEQQLHHLAARGLTYGVHLVVATGRWADFRAGVRDLFGTRLELRLGDPADSEIDRRSAAHVPADRPGRGLIAGGLQMLAALPRIDGDAEATTLADGLADLARRVEAAWSGPPAPPLRLLPDRLDRESLLSVVPADTPGLLIAIEEDRLAPVVLDPGRDPHLLVLGDGGSGKTSTLRGYLREVLRTRTSQDAQIVLVDYRRSLLGEVPDDYLLNYLAAPGQAAPVLQDLATFLEARIPGDGVRAEQLRRRSWWSGAEVYVVVDDYDLVAGPSSSPVSPLLPVLAQARDVGLHLVVARRAGGAARAMFDPVLQALRDLGQPGLLLSGDPEEGPLMGRNRPKRLPPGRGRLITRERGTQVVQVAWVDPAP